MVKTGLNLGKTGQNCPKPVKSATLPKILSHKDNISTNISVGGNLAMHDREQNGPRQINSFDIGIDYSGVWTHQRSKGPANVIVFPIDKEI